MPTIEANPMTDILELAKRVEAQSGGQRKSGPAVIVGPHGHCLAPEHVGGVVATIHGHTLRAKEATNEQ